MELITWLRDIEYENNSLSMISRMLAQAFRKQYPVPEGFIVQNTALLQFLQENTLYNRILDRITGDEGADAISDDLSTLSKNIIELFQIAELPWNMEVDLMDAYKRLTKNAQDGQVPVSLMINPLFQDIQTLQKHQAHPLISHPQIIYSSKGSSFLQDVKRTWAQLFSEECLTYYQKVGWDVTELSPAEIIVQPMIRSDIAGLMITSDPHGQKMVIDGVMGLYAPLLGTTITPDVYIIDRTSGQITEKSIQEQTSQSVWDKVAGAPVSIDLNRDTSHKQKVPDGILTNLKDLGVGLEKMFDHTLKIMWGLTGKNLYIYSLRPFFGTAEASSMDLLHLPPIYTTSLFPQDMSESPESEIGSEEAPEHDDSSRSETDPINSDTTAIGDFFSPQDPQPNEDPSPDETLEPATNRQLDSSQLEQHINDLIDKKMQGLNNSTTLVTATRILITLTQPADIERIHDIKTLPSTGVGLLDEDVFIRKSGRKDPDEFIKNDQQDIYISQLIEYISAIARVYDPRPVIFKFHHRPMDMTQPNALMGVRGASRFTTGGTSSQSFNMTLDALVKVREKYTNVWCALPFIRTIDEVEVLKMTLENKGLGSSSSFKIWACVQTPNCIFIADSLAEMIDGFIVDIDELTSFLMAANPADDRLIKAGYLDNNNQGVRYALEHLLYVAHQQGCSVTIYGNDLLSNDAIMKFLIRNNVDGISVLPDEFYKAIHKIESLERKIILEGLHRLEK